MGFQSETSLPGALVNLSFVRAVERPLHFRSGGTTADNSGIIYFLRAAVRGKDTGGAFRKIAENVRCVNLIPAPGHPCLLNPGNSFIQDTLGI